MLLFLKFSRWKRFENIITRSRYKHGTRLIDQYLSTWMQKFLFVKNPKIFEVFVKSAMMFFPEVRDRCLQIKWQKWLVYRQILENFRKMIYDVFDLVLRVKTILWRRIFCFENFPRKMIIATKIMIILYLICIFINFLNVL